MATNKYALTIVREKQFKKLHDVFEGAPSDWAAERGATHTLDCGTGPGKGTRPARLLKSVLYVGVDELDDQIVWERWDISHYLHDGAVTTASATGFLPVKMREEEAALA